MNRYYLPGILICGTLIYSGLAAIFPDLIAPESIKRAAGVYGGVIALLLIFLRQFLSFQGTDALKLREAERFNAVRSRIRQKIWMVVALCSLGFILLWGTGLVVDTIDSKSMVAGITGFFVSLALYLALAVAKWISDLAAFSDNLRLKEHARKYSEGVLKRLAEAGKNGTQPQR